MGSIFCGSVFGGGVPVACVVVVPALSVVAWCPCSCPVGDAVSCIIAGAEAGVLDDVADDVFCGDLFVGGVAVAEVEVVLNRGPGHFLFERIHNSRIAPLPFRRVLPVIFE